MTGLNTAAIYVIQTLGSLYLLIVLLRFILQLAQAGEGGVLGGDVLGGFGDRHQAAQAQVGQFRHGGGQGRQFLRSATGLARLAADVHLQADVQRWQRRRALGGEALGDLQPIHRVHPVEMFGNGFGLVGLDRTDEMPGQVQVAQFGLLGQGFLQVVLAEIGHAAGEGLADGGGRFGLAHGQQADT